MEAYNKMMELMLNSAGDSPIYNCMLSINDSHNNISYNGAKGTFGAEESQISPECRFRIGSMTKPFTAAILLQLVEEDLLNTQDLYFDLISSETKNILSGIHLFDSVDYSGNISVLHLLQHRSGLCDYFADDKRFLLYVMEHPSQSWNWKLVIEKYFEMGLNSNAAFKPGEGFHYSDTNYLLLAILIEQLTGMPLHQAFVERIIDPLKLEDTYLEFFQLPKKTAPVVFPYYGKHALENVNTSFDWGGGGLVSTMKDLDIFIRSLLQGVLFRKEETLTLMTQFNNAGEGNKSRSPFYGLGLQKKELHGYTFIGHSSAYGSMLFYAPNQEVSLVFSLNQAASVHKAEWLMNKIVKELLPDLQ